jgi:DNA-directed RNA polymerase subunit RPC12/RpoP
LEYEAGTVRHPPRRMFVVPEPQPRSASVIVSTVAPAIRGEGDGAGDASYMCGGCGTILLLTIREGSVRGIIFKCPTCGAFNQIERPEPDSVRQDEPLN